ncbi:MAG TPA: Holliday junction resolvase RuvX [Acidimicrobiales bacterium]|nr:Holliday junction resolvase RuvX [Acidimicrobiales bacterium]
MPHGRPQPAGRALGLDLGAKRIGIALSDDDRRVASALTVLSRGGSHAEDHINIARLVAETGATVVIVGLPLSLNGSEGPAAAAVRAEVEQLRLVVAVPVECADERYSSVVAHQALGAAGSRRPSARRAMVDKMAAAAILQTWLDRQRARCWSPGPASASVAERWGDVPVARRLPRRVH